MNGLCPACRRPYNDKDIEYKVITPEETAIHRARQVQKQKKNLQAQLKEKQKAEADSLSRKHLAGLRVVQKNLVYVTGLSPKLQEEELLHTLRGDTYFGQYGKIIKIVVSKARDRLDSVGVYVTYEKKEDAASCIAAVDGSPNGDRTLRAQFGTTKYCSAYLRGDACMNRNCMFLHEAGEAGESYSRADLSSMNAGSTQQGSSSRPPPPQSQQPMSAATQMVRTASDQPQSPTADRPALPSTASWASRPPQTQPTRTESRNASGSTDSPTLPAATPALPQPEPSPPSPVAEPVQEPEPEPEPEPQPAPQPVKVRKPRAPSPIRDLVRLFNPQDLCLEFSTANMPQSEIDILTSYPALFDSDGGAKRRLRRQKEEEQRRIELEQAAAAVPNVDTDDDPEMSGSMQLGGEPEEKDDESTRDTATTSGQDMALDQRFQFGGVSSPAGISERGLTPQQHQQLLLQTMKSPSPGSQGTYMNQSNGAFQQTAHAPGHQRNVSRFSFANDSSASTAVKPVANQKLMSQQSAMMPPNGINHFGGQQHSQGGQFFTSNVQGPPPGLKASGTPPVSGGMTFGQGHGFTTGGIQYGSNVGGRNVNDEMMRDLLRGRNASVTGSDAAKRELLPFPYQNPSSAGAGYSTSPYPGSASAQYASSMSSFGGESEKQRSKKKGKKHRHANTGSSSGGAGLVDAADGHLLQSRLQHGAFSGGPYMNTPLAPAGGMYNPSIHGGGYGGRWT
jgi:CCR4-NOT transcription complex subunit 4